ncbi:MAG: hypothetical protein KAV82_13680, partial [Phycisphaerae bacterium]|nr:hypothetical protein [Phycisphaerae bacterium]
PFIAGLLLWSYRWLIGVVWPRRGPMVVSAAILVAVLLGQVTLGGRLRQGLRDDELFWARRLDDLSSIRNQFHPAPPAVWAQLNVREAVYVFDMPTTVMEFTWSKDPARWAWELDAYQPDYIVVPTTPLQRENTERFVELLRQVRPTAKCVVELETVSLYRIPQDDARTRP